MDESVDQKLQRMHESIDAARTRSTSGTAAERNDAIIAFLQQADTLIASAIELIARGGTVALAGLPTEMQLMLQARRTRPDARMLIQCAGFLRVMPSLASLFHHGAISWSQLRSIVCAVRPLRSSERERVDALIEANAERLRAADPDELIHLIDDFVLDARAASVIANEERQMRSNFLVIQGDFDGGGTLCGYADAETLAVICNATDAAADRPQHPEDEGAPTRAQQRMQALGHICEGYLAGDSKKRTRPQPRILAVLDVAKFEDRLNPLDLLWRITGRPVRMSRVTTDMLLCDAVIQPIVTNDGKVLAVGDAVKPFSKKVRSALVARDKGCRFPGCGAPSSWSDGHHIIPHTGSSVEDLVLLCRRCHFRVHRYRWKLRWSNDGCMQFEHRGRIYVSRPPP